MPEAHFLLSVFWLLEAKQPCVLCCPLEVTGRMSISAGIVSRNSKECHLSGARLGPALCTFTFHAQRDPLEQVALPDILQSPVSDRVLRPTGATEVVYEGSTEPRTIIGQTTVAIIDHTDRRQHQWVVSERLIID